jgi:hypothetical protein
MNWNQIDRARVARLCLLERDIPRLSKAGMPSRSEGWGGLFKNEQYRLIRSASRVSIRWLRVFGQILMFRPAGLTLRATPALRAFPSLLRRGICFPSTETVEQHALYARVLVRGTVTFFAPRHACVKPAPTCLFEIFRFIHTLYDCAPEAVEPGR